MDVKEARNLIYDLLGVFYSKASVKHSKQPNTVKPKPPLVTLTTISVKRPLNPPQKIIDGTTVSYYPTRMALQIDLYTKGAPVEQRPGFIAPAENTALSDLLEFANFVASDYAVNWCHQHDVSIVLTGEAHDTSELINDASYQFRARSVLHRSLFVLAERGCHDYLLSGRRSPAPVRQVFGRNRGFFLRKPVGCIIAPKSYDDVE